MLDNEELFQNLSRPWYILNILFHLKNLCTLILKRYHLHLTHHIQNNLRWYLPQHIHPYNIDLQFILNILILHKVTNYHYLMLPNNRYCHNSFILHLLKVIYRLRYLNLPLQSLLFVNPSQMNLLILKALSLNFQVNFLGTFKALSCSLTHLPF